MDFDPKFGDVELWRRSERDNDFYIQVFPQVWRDFKWFNVCYETEYQVSIYNPAGTEVVLGFVQNGPFCGGHEGACEPHVKYRAAEWMNEAWLHEWEDVPFDATVQFSHVVIEFDLQFYTHDCAALRKLSITNSDEEETAMYFRVT